MDAPAAAEEAPSSAWRALLWRHRALCCYYALTSAGQSLPSAAMGLLLYRELGLAARPEVITTYYTACFATTMLKPLFGAASDRLPRAYRRRGMVIPGCLLAGCAQLLLGWRARGPVALYAFGCAAAAGAAVAETAADGALVESGGGASALQARLQVLSMAVRSAGSAAASPLGARLLRALSARAVVCLAACCFILAALVSVALPERASVAAPASQLRWADVSRALRRAAPAATLIFLLRLTPGSDDAYGAFLVSGMQPPLSAEQVGWVYTFGAWGALGGTLVAGAVFGRRPTLRELAGATLLASCLSLLRCAAQGRLGLPPFTYAALLSPLLSAASRLALMPQLVLSAPLAPPGGEAAGFAALTVVGDLGALGGGALTASLERGMGVGAPPSRSWAPLPALVGLTALLGVLPLLGLPWVPAAKAASEAEAEAELVAPLLEVDVEI